MISTRRKRKPGVAGAGEPRMPGDLSPDARKEWRRVTGLLRQRGVLDALDETALGDYITCWTRLRECEADIAARGVLVQGERGMVKNPACQLARQYRDSLVTWCREFGLTPQARERVRMPEVKSEDNPFAGF
jgi:P27 family predicted phage terminase small subunit